MKTIKVLLIMLISSSIVSCSSGIIPKQCSFELQNFHPMVRDNNYFRLSTKVDEKTQVFMLIEKKQGTILNVYNDINEISLLLPNSLSEKLWDKVASTDSTSEEFVSEDSGILTVCSEIEYKYRNNYHKLYFDKIYYHSLFSGAIKNTPMEDLGIYQQNSDADTYFLLGGVFHNLIDDFYSGEVNKDNINAKVLHYEKYNP